MSSVTVAIVPHEVFIICRGSVANSDSKLGMFGPSGSVVGSKLAERIVTYTKPGKGSLVGSGWGRGFLNIKTLLSSCESHFEALTYYIASS